MKFCDDHWKKLRAEVELQGLGKFVARTQEDLNDRLDHMKSPDGVWVVPPEAAGFEPLIGAHNAILANALDIVGIELFAELFPGEAKDRCPLCFLKAGCQDNAECAAKFENWIQHAVGDMVTSAKTMGLIKEH